MAEADITEMARNCVTHRGFVTNDADILRGSFPVMMLVDWSDTDLSTVGAFYGDMKDASPMACNGYPTFLAARVVHRDDVPLLVSEIERMEKALGIEPGERDD